MDMDLVSSLSGLDSGITEDDKDLSGEQTEHSDTQILLENNNKTEKKRETVMTVWKSITNGKKMSKLLSQTDNEDSKDSSEQEVQEEQPCIHGEKKRRSF